jgi:hypothetical protein
VGFSKLTSWETESTKVIHAIRGDNYKIAHGVGYYTKVKALLNAEEEAKKKETESKL